MAIDTTRPLKRPTEHRAVSAVPDVSYNIVTDVNMRQHHKQGEALQPVTTIGRTHGHGLKAPVYYPHIKYSPPRPEGHGLLSEKPARSDVWKLHPDCFSRLDDQ